MGNRTKIHNNKEVITMRVCPCKGCVPPKRNSTCHSECKDYKDWKNEHDQHVAEDRDRRNLQRIMNQIPYSKS